MSLRRRATPTPPSLPAITALRAPCLLAALVAILAPPAAAAETWQGAIQLPGAELDVTVRLDRDPATGATAGRIDIPAQGARGLALSGVVLSAKELAFDIAPVGAQFRFTVAEDGTTATGELRQHGMTFPGTLRKLTEEQVAEAKPKRPQEPRPPFPYAQWEVVYRNANDGTKLAGTLTLPPGPGPFPAALLITGSGPQDRDEAIMGHRPFAVLADHLSRRGIAVLRADDRGVGGSTGSLVTSTAEDLVGDARAAIAFLRGLETIDGDRIGVIGHSEGGILAPMVAARDRRLSFVVMLAGTGVTGQEILREQMAALMRVAGAPEAMVAEHVRLQQELLGRVVAGESADRIREAAAGLVQAQSGGAAQGAQLETMVAGAVAQTTSRWFASFLALDPRESLRRVRCPVLALNGSLDLQVVPSQNLPEIEKALKAGGNRDATTRELPGLNHLFQHATTGAVAEYAQLEETMSPEVLDLVASWITARTAPR
jgi:hypothetical protein